jgi:hypothetical protein
VTTSEEITQGVDAALAKLSQTPTSTSRFVLDSGRYDAYTSKALQDECDAITGAPDGTQNDTINAAAFNVGTLVGAGAVDEKEAREVLLSAARAGNHPESRALPTIESGLRAGMAQPRPWPPVTRRAELQVRAAPSDHTTPGSDIEAPADGVSALSKLFVPGGSFILDVPPTPPAVWGRGGEVLWAQGEALMIAAPQGVGKTTLAFQLVRARLGLQESVLGYPVVPGEQRLLYLAMDRPAQAQRAANRLFTEEEREVLNERLVFWKGPPPYDMAKQTDILAAMCEMAGADSVIVDSLKDAAIGLSDDAVGAAYNRARQKALSNGVQVLELHHNRKAGTNGGEPNTLADVYGSVWLPSGAGSVISLYGEAGDPVVSFRHLKQPMDEVGPFQVVHDHPTGVSSVMHTVDIFELVKASGPEGLTAARAAEAMYSEGKKPSLAQKEKARRRLDKLVEEGHLVKHDGPSKTSAATYYLGTLREAS